MQQSNIYNLWLIYLFILESIIYFEKIAYTLFNSNKF
jgi:hypothetical protein